MGSNPGYLLKYFQLKKEVWKNELTKRSKQVRTTRKIMNKNVTLNSIVHWMSSALVSTSTIPFLTSLTWHSMAKAADCVARTSRQGARFRFIDVTTTDRKVPSSKGPKFRDIPSVIIPWLTKPPTLKLRKIPKLMTWHEEPRQIWNNAALSGG